MKNKIVLIAAFTLAATGAQAALIASYNDGTDADAAALTNLASATGVTVSGLDDVGFDGGDVITRDEFGTNGGDTPAGLDSSAGSEWLFARSNVVQSTAGSDTDYFGFTVTADGENTLDLTNLTFDFAAKANNTNASALGTYSAQVFYAVDGGTSFTSIGSAVRHTVNTTTWSPVTNANINLSTITGASSVEIRIGIGDGGLNDNGSAAWVQGIKLNGTVVIPEPSTAASVLGVCALFMLCARRKRVS